MATSFDVRFWKNEVLKGKTTTTYRVRWTVAGRPFRERFATAALADSYRAELVSAARKGEPFEEESGLPLSLARKQNDLPWFTLAVRFADMKWPEVAATTRRTHAEALAKLTVGMLATKNGCPDPKWLRHVLNRWAFNPMKRDSADCPNEVKVTLRWLERNTRLVSALADKEVLREVLSGLRLKLDGTPGSPDVVSRCKRIFNTALEYAVEVKALDANPLKGFKWVVPRVNLAVDKRAVANPVQVRTLLQAVREGRNGERLVAFFGCLYYAALRPEEAVGLRRHNLRDVPQSGWGGCTWTRPSRMPAGNGPTTAPTVTSGSSSKGRWGRAGRFRALLS